MREVNPLAHKIVAEPTNWKPLIVLVAAFAVILGITFFYSNGKHHLATAPTAAHSNIAPALHKQPA